MTACPNCKRALFVSELRENLSVCPGCSYHFRLNARERIAFIADEGSFLEHDADADARDRLSFPHYEEKLDAARRTSGEHEAVITGCCTIGGHDTALFIMERAAVFPSFPPASLPPRMALRAALQSARFCVRRPRFTRPVMPCRLPAF